MILSNSESFRDTPRRFFSTQTMILTHKVIALDEHSEDPTTLGIYDTEEIAQRVADSYNLMWENCMLTAHVITLS